MNRIYRLVWSRVRNAWLVAAETSRGQGKGAGRKLTRAARALKAAAAGLVGQAFVAASGILLAVNSSAVIAQSIRADGRTQTVVTTSGPITNITTGTVSGVNAFNSFAVFNVGQGATANLFLPTGTVNLINLVRDERSMINGTLNSVMNGHIGGNVYFANPLGFVVGAQGVLNVGSLNVTTPTRSFVDNFFNAFGVPNAAATAQLLGGGAPIDPSGLISIRGRVNAVNGVSLRAGNVDVSGTLVTGARFAGSAPDFSDVVNVNGLNTGSQLIESGGRIMIVADNDVTVSGTIATPGGPRVRGGDISITAGGNVGIAAGANVSVRGNGENSAGGTINMYGSTAVFSAGARIDASAGSSGDGGAIEFSARDTVTLAGGEFAAGAANGRAGSVLVDPNNIELVGSNQIVSGANYSLVANNSIMVNSGVIISTRNIGASTDYDNAVSAGNSGDISLTAPSITLNTGSKLLAQVETGSLFQGGAVTLTATQTNGGTAQINLLQSTLSGKSVTLQASSILNDASPALLVLSGINTSAAAANILLDSSQVTAAGGALNISSLASVNVSATGPIPLAVLRSTSNATVDVKGSSSLTTTTGNASLGATSSVTSTATPTSPFAALAGDAMVATSDVTSTASVHLGDTASANIGGTLGLAATNTVTTTQVANAAASGASAAGAVVALSIMNNTTSATVDGQASIANAKALNLSALSTNTATVTAKAAAQGAQEDSSGTSKGSQTLASYKDDMKTGDSGSGGVKVAGAVAVSDLKNVTQAYLASSQQANIDGAATLTSRVTNSATVGADGSATSGSVGVGVAVAVNVAKSTNQSYIAQNVTAQSLALTAAMNPAATTGQFTTTAVSGAGASNVGVAGSIAVNVLDLSSTAAVNGGSLITIAGGGSGNVSLVAENLTASSASATPSGSGASGSSVGIGAAVAVNVVSNRAIAQLSDNAGLAGVTNTSLNDVTVKATGADTVTTQAEAGAAGGVAITPVAAINVINNTTTAQLGSNGTPLILGGSLLVAAEHSASTTASAKGSAKGSSAAVGAAVAVNLVNDTATATTSREVQAGANVTFNAHAASASSASAIASAAGGKSDDQKAGDDGDIDTKVDKQLQSGKDMQASNKVGDSSERANTQSQKSASASSSEGKISVAAAVAVNLQKSTARATVPDNGKITAGGALKVSSSNNTDGAALTDGSAVGSTAAVGIGAGISINLVKSVNEASIGQNALVSASGITLEALMKDVKGDGSDFVNTFNTEAKSGAGGSKVGLAGSLALNLIDTSSQALLKSGAQAHALGGNVSLTADDRTSTTGKALPADGGGASGGKVGIGASVAVNVVANRSTAEIQDTAKLDGARDLSLQANGQFDMLTQAEAGSQGGISITPSVAVSVVNNSTTARVGASATALKLTGDLLVQAQQTSSTSTLAKGSSQGAKAAIGAAVAVALVDDEVSATTAREINATGAAGAGKGNVSFLAHGDSASSASATASAVGGNTDDDAGKTDPNTGKKTEDASVDDKVKTQSDFGKKQQADNNVGDAKQKGSTTTAADGKPSASSSEGKISVAAAVAVNLQQSNVRATVPDSGKITAAGRLTLSSSNNTDGAALTDGSAVGSTTTLGIGAGISINLVKSVNEASIGQNAQVSSNGITLEALMKDVKGDGSDLVNTIDAEAKSGAGGTKVGLAGSLALNLIDTSSQALVKTGADLNAGAGSVSLTADDRTTVTGKALPADDSGATGGKVGIGVSVAVNIVANRATAEIQDTAKLATTGDLNLGATGKFAVNTEVEAGASGGVAITPAVALAIVNNTSIARLGSGLELTNPGAVTISVDHSSTTTTSAKGSAQGDKAAVGAAVGIVLLNDVAAASIERNIQTATGPVSISASANSASTNTATASAVGGKSTDDAGQTDPNTGKKSEDATVDDKVNNQTAYGKKSQTDNGVGNSSQQSATANADSSKTSASSDEGQVAVAAAVAVNIISAKATAKLADGVTVKTSGALAVNASGNTDSSTTSSGSAVGSTAKVGIGAAVSVNKVDSHNEASIGQNAQVVAQGVTVESKMTDVAGDTTNTFDAQAQSGAGGSKVGIAASLALNVIDTSGKALIKSGASIDAGGDLNMTAEDFSKTTGNAAPTTTGGATGGKVGIGASVALNLIDSAAQAQIGAGAGVSNAGSITITATTKADSDAEATAGATGGKLAFDAAVAVTTLNQTTDASIAWGSGISASGNVGLAAASSGTHTANTVGTAKSGSVAIGASVGVITSSSTTTATIDRNLGTSGSFSLAATADRSYEATAKASASGTQATDTYTNNQAQADKSASSSTLKNNQNSQTNQGTQGQGKVNVAAAVSVLVIGDDATASVTGGRTIQSGVGQAMSISATNNSNFSARGAGDAVDPASKVGVGIGVGIVIANNKTSAALANNTHVVQSGALSVLATSTQNTDTAFANKLTAEGIAGAGGSNVGVAGAFAVVDSNLITTAKIGDNTKIDQSGAIIIDAENTSTLSAKAWAGAFGNVGVGASVATVISNNQYTALLGGGTTDVTASSLSITARNNKFSPTPFTLTLGNIGDLSDEAGIKAEFTSITDQMKNGKLLGGGNYYTEAAAGAAGDKVAVAGSFAVNVFKDLTDASIGGGATINANSGTVAVTASNDTVARSLAGSASAGGSVGIGVSSADVASTNVTSSHIDAGAKITQSGGIKVKASNTLDIEVIGIAAAASGTVAVGGVVNVITLNNSADAYIANSTATSLISAGTFELGATNTVTGLNIASGLSASGSVGVGIAAATNTIGTDSTHQFGTHAYIGDGATVNAGTTTLLNATASENLTTFAIAGAASGSVSVGGAAVVNVMNTDTKAYVGSGAKVNKAQSLVSQSASLSASDTTSLFDVVVGVGLGGTVGVGASGDVGVLSKSTQAYIGNGAWLETSGNLQVQSAASEDFRSIAIGLGVGGTAGGAGSVSVYSLTTNTLAYVDDNATVRTRGNALITADDATVMNLISGSAAGGGTAAIGAAAGVTVFDKTTRAYIGANADVEVLGNGASGIAAATGDIGISFGSAIGGNGQVKSSGITPKDAQGNTVTSANGNSIGDRNAFQGLAKTRTATPATTSIRGLAVTATNRDKLESFSVTGAAGGAAAITLGGNVAVLTTDTEAEIRGGAKINQNGTPANAAQSVRVAAGSDQFHIGLAGAASGAGGVAVGAGADVIVASNTIKATIGKNAQVKAARDVEVLAHGQEQYLEMGAGLAAAGSLAIAGSVGVISITDKTYATIEGGTGATTKVDAGGNVRVNAGDDTETNMISGAAAAGFGVAGLGVALGVNIIEKDTQATIGNGVSVNALGAGGAPALTAYLPGNPALPLNQQNDNNTTTMHGLQVQATSKEDLFVVSASGAAGLYAGVSGAVTVTTVKSNTAAAIGDSMKINLANSCAASDQDVNVTARNQLKTMAFTGSVAISGGVGLSGGVDVFTAKNNTSAKIGAGSEIHVLRDVAVNALATQTMTTTVVSAAGGALAGIAGGVSVYSVGDKLNADSQGQLTSSGDVKGEADSQAKDGSLNDSLLGSSTDANVKAVSTQAKTKRAAVSTDLATTGTPAAGNSATIGDNAKIYSGRNVAVNSRGSLNFTSTTGAAGVGALGLGFGIGISNFTLNNQATLGLGTEVTAGGDLIVRASLNENAQGLAFAGAAGIAAANAAWSSFSDNSTTRASVGSGANVHAANHVVVEAKDVRTLDAQSIGASIGALAVGASVATASVGGTTSAFIGSGSFIGAGTDVVGNLTVSADSRVKATSSTLAAAGGLGLAASGSAATATAAPTVTAYVDGGTIDLTGDAKVQAVGSAGASADAEGFNVSVGAAVGASIALANASPVVSAYLGNNTVLSANTLTVSASHLLPDFLYGFNSVLSRSQVTGVSVMANASGASGALLLGATATDSEADYGTAGRKASVTANVGNGSSLTVPGTLSVSAVRPKHRWHWP